MSYQTLWHPNLHLESRSIEAFCYFPCANEEMEEDAPVWTPGAGFGTLWEVQSKALTEQTNATRNWKKQLLDDTAGCGSTYGQRWMCRTSTASMSLGVQALKVWKKKMNKNKQTCLADSSLAWILRFLHISPSPEFRVWSCFLLEVIRSSWHPRGLRNQLRSVMLARHSQTFQLEVSRSGKSRANPFWTPYCCAQR